MGSDFIKTPCLYEFKKANPAEQKEAQKTLGRAEGFDESLLES
jgi:hypothetical protein